MTPTADLCDAHPEVAIVEIPLLDYGARSAFGGRIATVALFEDNALVRQALQTPGEGRVLVVDGGGSRRRALVGDRLAQLAVDNGWAGIVVHGCIRDAAVIASIDIGLKALGTCPRKTIKRGEGRSGEPVRFGGVTFEPGHYLYADADGILVSDRDLLGAQEST